MTNSLLLHSGSRQLGTRPILHVPQSRRRSSWGTVECRSWGSRFRQPAERVGSSESFMTFMSRYRSTTEVAAPDLTGCDSGLRAAGKTASPLRTAAQGSKDRGLWMLYQPMTLLTSAMASSLIGWVQASSSILVVMQAYCDRSYERRIGILRSAQLLRSATVKRSRNRLRLTSFSRFVRPVRLRSPWLRPHRLPPAPKGSRSEPAAPAKWAR